MVWSHCERAFRVYNFYPNFFHLIFQDGDVSLCSIANDIRIDSEYDLTDSLEPAKILEILNTVGCSIYSEADFHSKTDKAEWLQEGIFFLLQLFARGILVMKMLEIEKTKPTFIISTFKTDIGKVGLVFLISNIFIAKTSLANKWKGKKIPSYSNSALVWGLEKKTSIIT